MKRVIHLISLLLFSSLSLAGQIGSLDFKYYNQNAGFNFIKITGLYMDSKNYLWICSEAGLCKFDGVKFDYYYSSNQLDIDLSGDFTFSPIEDIQNNLWIGTQNGMSYYNRKLNSFIQIHIAKRKKISKKSNYYTRPFYIDHEGWVWLYTNGEILKYHPKNSSINFIFRNSNGMNYSPQKFYEELETFASNETKGFHIHNMRDGKIDSSIFIERFDNSLIDVYHFSFVADSMLWLSTNLGLLSYDILSGKFSRYDQMNGKTVKITHHAIWGDSMIFVSTYGQGVLLFDTRHKKFVKQWLHQADNEFSIHSNTVNQCYITRNNLLVLGYKNQGMGIASLTPTVIKNTNAWNQVYEKADERNIVGISSISDQELLLTNSQNELILFDLIKNKPSFIKKIVNPIPSIDHYHSELSLPNGTILMYHEGMFISVHKKTKKIEILKDATSKKHHVQLRVLQLLYHHDTIYLATERGLQRLNIFNNQYEIIPEVNINKQLEWGFLDMAYFINDSIFICHSRYTTLELFSKRKGNFIKSHSLRASFEIFDIVVDKNFAFFATNDGVFRLAIDTKKLERITDIRSSCYALFKTSNGLLISSDMAICEWDMKKNKVHRFDHYHGVPTSIFNMKSKEELTNGYYFGNRNGLTFVNKEIPNNRRVYKPYISKLMINEVHYTDSNINEMNFLNLKYDQNYLSFEFSNIGYIDAMNNLIFYKLEGADLKIQKLYGAGLVRYPHLSPGDYCLIVYNQENQIGQTLTIIIHPPFWKTWWFRLIILIIGFITVYFIIKYRTMQLQKKEHEKLRLMLRSQEEERKRIARDLHDDFGARLSAIKLFLKAATKSGNNQNELVQTSSEAIDQTIVELRHLLVHLSPKSLSENGLKAAIEEITEMVLKSKELDIELDLESYKELKDSEFNFVIYRIILELINNTIKYANATQINISLVTRVDVIVMIYHDNGIGFEMDKIKKGYGLQNIFSYVESRHAEMTFNSYNSKGVNVIIEFPI